MVRSLLIAALLVGCSGGDATQAMPSLTQAGPVQPPPLVPVPTVVPAPQAPSAPDAGAPSAHSGPRVKLAWEIGPLRRLGWGIYRNEVELVVHVRPPVRIRIPSLQYCWQMANNPSEDPVPGAVAVLSCYNAGYGDYLVIARESGRAAPSPGAVERYVVRAYGRGEGIEEAAPVERLRTVGHFEAPSGTTFESELSWPHGAGDQVRDDDS